MNDKNINAKQKLNLKLNLIAHEYKLGLFIYGISNIGGVPVFMEGSAWSNKTVL